MFQKYAWWGMMVGLTAAIWVSAARAADEVIDLTDASAVVRTVVEGSIFDTRLVQPQIQGSSGWSGPITTVKEHLPPHSGGAGEPAGPPNDLAPGALGGGPSVAVVDGFAGIQQTRYSPPDPTLAVGPTHVVETVNSTVTFFTRDGQITFSVDLDSRGNPGFFEDVGAGDFVVDPRVLFDQYEQRFVIIAIEVYFGARQATIDIAVSDDSDPHGVWFKYRTNAVIRVGNQDQWPDYPGEGYDTKAYYVPGNLFNFSGGGGGGVLFRIFDKAPLLTGQPAVVTDLRVPNAGSVQAVHSFGDVPAAYFASTGNGSTMNLHAIADPLGQPSVVTAAVNVPSYNRPGRFSVPTPDGSIDSLDGRVINAHWRGGNLYSGHPIFVQGRNVARWYHFQTNNWPSSGTPTLVQSGNVDAGGNLHTFFPAIYSDAGHNVGLVVAKSSASVRPTIEVTGRRPGDPPGQMGALELAKESASGYAGGRYGDYFDMAIDPNDDLTFWSVGQYASARNTWGTWISHFNVGAGGGVSCDDVKKLKASCRRNNTVKARLKLNNGNHSGEIVTFGISRLAVDARISGKKAKVKECCFSGSTPVTLLDPSGCVDPISVDCP